MYLNEKSITYLTLSALLLSATLCATIFTGTKQTIGVNTTREGADVQVNGIDRGQTPVALRIKNGFTGETVAIKKEGYKTKIFQPEITFNPVSVLNLFGLLGWGIDAATGAMMKYDPKAYDLKLEPVKEQ